MNKFIILPCFTIVVSLHILFFLYYRKNEIITSIPNKNASILFQLIKVKEIQKTIEKSPEQKKEIVKNQIQKNELAKKPIKIPKEEPTKEKTKDIKQIIEKENKPQIKMSEIPSKKKEEKLIPKVDYKEERFIDDYSSKLREEINKNKNYPTISKKLKEEGRVVLSFRVLKSGQFINIRILVSSNKERLDKAALNALYDTKKYQAFEKTIDKEFLDFELPLEFKFN